MGTVGTCTIFSIHPLQILPPPTEYQNVLHEHFGDITQHEVHQLPV